MATTQTSVKGLNDSITKLEKQIKQIQQPKENVDVNELNTIKKDVEQAQDELKQLLDDKAYYDVASSLLKDTGIKTNIIKQYLPVMNKLVNKYLTSMDFFVNFEILVGSNHRAFLVALTQVALLPFLVARRLQNRVFLY